ncbi:farnesol dehydrogenase-like isoform X2 [Agrilus planipennis]|uniref:Farnesol dehydrogenase-like isoform X2 n=1 Tax=Agrilus planipennis TaxID=224129 RepID=A0A1W4WYW2_AGRPL|nr:farnesol dehydrogenase-like isoform X2 [Agrilus planipennis]
MDRWVGKVAVVTGASAGIGASIAVKLAQTGIIVAGFARRKEGVEEFAKGLQRTNGKLYGVKVDVSKEKEIIEGFNWVKKNLGPVHILINNAGIIRNNTLIDGNFEQWKEIFDTNVLGLCLATREAVKNMRESNVSGHVIHINSRCGHRVPNVPNVNVYPASKHAVTALAETLRHELHRNNLNIKITNISPGHVDTDIIEFAGFSKSTTYNGRIPLKVDDVTESVLYALRTPSHVQVAEITLFPVTDAV